MGKFRLNRRTVLRGAGSIAIALPWLEVMGEQKVAHAQAAGDAKRFLSVYTPGGTVAENFWPTGSEAAPVFGSILAPLEPLKSKILALEGLDYKCKAGEQHQAGIIAFLTGSKQDGSPNNYSSYASIDQVIASKISKGIKAKPSLLMAVRWATGKSKGQLHPINSMNFEDTPQKTPISPLLDPVAIYNELFGNLEPGGAPAADARMARRKSVLDFVDKRYVSLAAKLGASDKTRLEDHLSKIRDIELGLDKGVVGGGVCRQPTKVDTTGYNPTTGLNSNDVGGILDVSTDNLIPTAGKLMMDMMVMAFACDITAVGSFQWTDTEAKHTFPWLNVDGKVLSEHHHFYQHDGGYKPIELTEIYKWYSEMHFYLLDAMQKVDMGGHTLLDESVVVFGSELAHPPAHTATSLPFLLAGGGGGLTGGRHLNYGGRSHNDLLVAILNLFGDARTSYGDAAFNNGALSNLKG